MAGPTVEIERDVHSQLQASRPYVFKLLVDPPVVFREVLDRRILAVKTCHPFVMREADRRNTALKPPGEISFTGTKKAVNQTNALRALWEAVAHPAIGRGGILQQVLRPKCPEGSPGQSFHGTITTRRQRSRLRFCALLFHFFMEQKFFLPFLR
jgi:hypothetical protein